LGVGRWGGVGGVGGGGGVTPCARTFQGLHSVRLWTPTIFIYLGLPPRPFPKIDQAMHI
jgi:hypothetical protein